MAAVPVAATVAEALAEAPAGAAVRRAAGEWKARIYRCWYMMRQIAEKFCVFHSFVTYFSK